MRIPKRFIESLLTSTAWWLGVAVSLMLHLLFIEVIENKNEAEFNYRAHNAQLAIQTRVRSYVEALRSTSALFYSGSHVTCDQFQSYVRGLDLEKRFSGIRHIDFAPRIRNSEKDDYISAVRRHKFVAPGDPPSLAISPPGERDEYQIIAYVEPMDPNRDLLGRDLAADPMFAEALSTSRDRGEPMLSSRGAGDESSHVPGITLRLPVYRPGLPVGTEQERRHAYVGSVGAIIDLATLIRGTVDPDIAQNMRIRIHEAGTMEQYVSNTYTSARVLFDSAAAAGNQDAGLAAPDGNRTFTSRTLIGLGPWAWEAEFSTSKSSLGSRLDAHLAWVMLFAGIAASTLLHCIYYSMMTARARAIELAREMTKDLRASEASLAEAQRMARLGSWTLDPATWRLNWSAETCRIFGMRNFRNIPRYEEFLARVHISDRDRVRTGIERAITGGEEFDTEHRITRLDGTVRWVHLICRLGADGSDTLLRGTIMDVTGRKQTMEALKRSRQMLRELTAHQDRVKEEERKRIAREIHDELGQTLLALRIDVSLLDARTGKSHPRLNEKVRMALNQIDATVKTVRSIINNLRPAVLDLGLTAAMEWQVAQFRRRTGIACDLHLGPRELLLDDACATSLFRILQESLTNVIRHASASHVLVEMHQESNRLVMKITDNGVGMRPEQRRSGSSFGLVGVEERVHALGGEFRVSSTPGKGTRLTVHIPVPAALDNPASPAEAASMSAPL